MLVIYYACTPDKQCKTCVYSAIVAVDDKGNTLVKEMYEYDVSDKGKYWGHLRTIKQVLKVINDLVEARKVERNTTVRVIVPASIIMLWFSKGRAVEPYRYAFELLLQECQGLPCEVDFVQEMGTINKAKRYACKECMPQEKYQNFLEAYSNK